MVDSPILNLPLLSSSQSQKHATVNSALLRLDSLVQLTVLDRDLTSPPGSPVDGDRYIVGASPTGLWSGQADKVALRIESVWRFVAPRAGWTAWIEDEDALFVYDGLDWIPVVDVLAGVSGPLSSTNKAIARFSDTTGDALGNSTVLLSDAGEITLPNVTSPATPSSDTLNLFTEKLAGEMKACMKKPGGRFSQIQEDLESCSITTWNPSPSSAALTVSGGSVNATGTLTASNVATSSKHESMKRVDYLVTVADIAAVAGVRAQANSVWRGNAAGFGGFRKVLRWGPATGVSVSTTRAFAGLSNSTSAPTDVEPSTLINCVGMGWDAADTNIQFLNNDGSGTADKTDLGSNFPVPSADRTNIYELILFCEPNGSEIFYLIRNLLTGNITSGSKNSNIPGNTILMSPRCWMSVGGTSSVIGVAIMGLFMKSDI